MHPYLNYGTANNGIPQMQMQFSGMPNEMFSYAAANPPASGFVSQPSASKVQDVFEEDKIFALVQEVLNPVNREAALL